MTLPHLTSFTFNLRTAPLHPTRGVVRGSGSIGNIHFTAPPVRRCGKASRSSNYMRALQPKEKIGQPSGMSKIANTKPTEIKRRKRAVSAKIIHAVELLASGKARTQSEAAAMASVTPEWLSKMLGRPEIGVLLEQTCRKYLRNGTVRATARLVELLDSPSARTSLETSKHVLGIQGITPPSNGAPIVNVGLSVGYVIDLSGGEPRTTIEVKPNAEHASAPALWPSKGYER